MFKYLTLSSVDKWGLGVQTHPLINSSYNNITFKVLPTPNSLLLQIFESHKSKPFLP